MSRIPLEVRFWAKVDTSAGLLACWPWLGARQKNGYGKIAEGGLGGRVLMATHVALALAGRPVPPGHVARHVARHVVCDNPPCVNPAHLAPGTVGDNHADMVGKGRSTAGDRHPSRLYPERRARGERNGAAKLTVATVRLIRARYAHGGITMTALAAEYGVSRRAVGMAVQGLTWPEASA